MEKVEEKKVGQEEETEETVEEPTVAAEEKTEEPKIEEPVTKAEAEKSESVEAEEKAGSEKTKSADQEAVKKSDKEEGKVEEPASDKPESIQDDASSSAETSQPEPGETKTDPNEEKSPAEATEPEAEQTPDAEKTEAGFEDEQLQQLLEESLGNIKNIQIGDKVEGEIINITDSFIFVSLGGKRDAYAEKVDYQDKDGNLPCKIGDNLAGYVVKYTETETFIAKSLVSVNKRVLREAFEAEIPVSGKVTAFTKGGFIVDVSGVRSFCPKSHIDTKKALDVKLYVGKNYDFRIIDFKDNGRDIVVSRKVILNEEIEKQKKATLEKLESGSVVKGKVVRLTNFGAFVDLGGIEGLLHISEISWVRVESPSEMLSIGDKIEVKIIKLKGEKISLSMKALQEDPFDSSIREIKEGDAVNCKVLRNLPFGSFVEIKPGVEGLIPISELSLGRRINHPSEIVNEGDMVEAQIMKINADDKKISLSLKALQPDPWENIFDYFSENDVVTGIVENVVNFGAFIKIKDGLTGLMPSSKMKIAGMTMDKSSIGEEIKIRVVKIDVGSKRISLEPSELPESAVEGSSDWRKYRKDKSHASESTFADLL